MNPFWVLEQKMPHAMKAVVNRKLDLVAWVKLELKSTATGVAMLNMLLKI